MLKVTAQQVADCYKELGSSNKVAKHLGIGQSSVLRLLQGTGLTADGLTRWRQGAQKLTAAQNEEIRAKYEAGALSADLARDYGVTIYTIKQAIKRVGGELRVNPSPTLLPGELETMILLAEEGYSQKTIAAAANRSQAFVSRHLRNAGVKFSALTRENHGSWRGGRYQTDSGYWRVLVEATDPLAVMRDTSGYVLEHRLVMARKLGRPLTRHETVHHKDGDRTNNTPDNLQLRQGKHGKGVVLTCACCGSHDIISAPLADSSGSI